MSEPISVRGNNGTVELRGRRVIITKSGGSKGERVIPLAAITGVTVRPPQFMSPGYIQVLTAGAREVNDSDTVGKVFNDSLVAFGPDMHDRFRTLRDAILDAIDGDPPKLRRVENEATGPQSTVAGAPVAVSVDSTEGQLGPTVENVERPPGKGCLGVLALTIPMFMGWPLFIVWARVKGGRSWEDIWSKEAQLGGWAGFAISWIVLLWAIHAALPSLNR